MTTLALYARVSTTDQHPEAQLDALRAYAARRGGAAGEYVDRGVSGAKDRRLALDRLLADARARRLGAVVVVKLDRLARSVRHLTALAAELASLGVDLVVLDQGIDTGTPTGRLLFHILGSIAEFERDLIRERTRAGLAAARRRGARIGRPRALSPEAVERARRLRRSGRSLAYVAWLLGVGKATVHRALAADRARAAA